MNDSAITHDILDACCMFMGFVRTWEIILVISKSSSLASNGDREVLYHETDQSQWGNYFQVPKPDDDTDLTQMRRRMI